MSEIITEVTAKTHPVSTFSQLPNEAFVNIQTVKALLGCSASTVWREVARNNIPSPYRLSIRNTRWNVGELRQALASKRGA